MELQKRYNLEKRAFKRHYTRAQHLKEGGKAWDREITKARHHLEEGRKLYDEILKSRYN